MFTIDARIAQLSAPPSLPLNNELRLMPIGRMERSFDRIAVDLDAAVAKKQRQPVPVIERGVDRLRQLRLQKSWSTSRSVAP